MKIDISARLSPARWAKTAPMPNSTPWARPVPMAPTTPSGEIR